MPFRCLPVLECGKEVEKFDSNQNKPLRLQYRVLTYFKSPQTGGLIALLRLSDISGGGESAVARKYRYLQTVRNKIHTCMQMITKKVLTKFQLYVACVIFMCMVILFQGSCLQSCYHKMVSTTLNTLWVCCCIKNALIRLSSR